MEIDEIINFLRNVNPDKDLDLIEKLEIHNERQQAKSDRRSRRLKKILVMCIVMGVSIWYVFGQGIAFIALMLTLLVTSILTPVRRSLLMRAEEIEELKKYVVLSEICSEFGFKYESNTLTTELKPFFGLSIIPGEGVMRVSAIEDNFVGNVGGKNLRILQIDLGDEWAPYVLMVKMDFYKVFKGTTVVTGLMNKFSRKVSQKLGRGLRRRVRIGEPVKIEDPIFEELYEINSTDQLEARYLLTPNFIERTLKVGENPDIYSFNFAFYKGQIILSIQSERNFFDPNAHKLSDTDYCLELVKDLIFVLEILKVLKLDQKTKI